MRSIIKYVGGKYSEIRFFERYLPEFDRYIEPFFGSGALFFHLQPDNAIINDICPDLINFYKLLKVDSLRDVFKGQMDDLVHNWKMVDEYENHFSTDILDIYYNDNLSFNDSVCRLLELMKSKRDIFNNIFNDEFIVDKNDLYNKFNDAVLSKLNKSRARDNISSQITTPEMLRKIIETGFKSGFYNHLRKIFNLSGKGYELTIFKYTAIYFFIREFCFCSMFRYNKKGFFNIPYGGISYNKKKLDAKVAYVFSDNICNLLSNTKIKNNDFEFFLNRLELTENDFIFLDPPYDCVFNTYNGFEFRTNDQKRLAEWLYKTKAKFMLVVKDTVLISNLYKKKDGIFIRKFKKKYMCHIKNQNMNTNVVHLIITNYKWKI